MADTKISLLPSAALPLDTADLVPVVQGGVNKKAARSSFEQTTVTGNAGTATALQTARTINGTAFDGTANITINAVDSTARVPATRAINTTAPLTGGGDMSADRTLAITAATVAVPGSMSAADKAKLDAISGTNTGDQTNISGNAATVTTNANLTGPVTSTGNATAIANGAITNAMLANGSVANLSGTNTGDNATNTQYSSLVSNATHTGDVTGATALTLATVNSNVGSFTNANIIVNAKGLITAAANGAVGGSGDFKADGTVAMTGAIATTVGTMTSSVANGASAVAFNKNTVALSTSGALIERWQNNGATKATIDKDGNLSLAAGGGTLSAGAVIFSNNAAFAITNSLLFDSTYKAGVQPGAFAASNDGIYGFCSGTIYGTAIDTGLSRNAAGVVEINNGTAGTFRDLKLRNLIATGGVTFAAKTVGTLPSAAASANQFFVVTDATTPVVGMTVAGGGSTQAVVRCNNGGTAYIVTGL